jgi:hypothetical protein
MKPLLALAAILFLGGTAWAQESRPTPCLIVKHASAAHQFLVSGANWQYVAGEFPPGMKWKSNITDRNIRKIKQQGGRVIVIQPNYTMTDLEQAKASCSQPEKSAHAEKIAK